MKPCPFCAESIQDAAIKCRYCGSLLVPSEMAPEGALLNPEAGEDQASRSAPRGVPVTWIAAGVLVLIGLFVAAMLLLTRGAAPPPAVEQAAAPGRPATPHRAFGIAWGTPINEVAAQLASRGFRFVEQDEEGDHVFQGDIDGHPAVVIAMLARGALAKTIVIMVGEQDAARLYKDTVQRLTEEYGAPASESTSNGQPVTRWPDSGEEGRGTRLWTTVTDRGDVAIHYESELWPSEARRRRAKSANGGAEGQDRAA